MLACVDVDYRGASKAVAACVLFEDWTASDVVETIVAVNGDVAHYEPGQFYKRELPCLVSVLRRVPVSLEAIVVDGHVWLDGSARPGLGARLYEALAERIAIVGVAKNKFGDGSGSAAITRGASSAPLYVSAVGLDPATATASIEQMAGPHRIPTILKHADRGCRDYKL